MESPTHEWILREAPADALKSLESGEVCADLPDLVKQLLAQRGIVDSEELSRFLQPRLADLSDPFLLPEMEEAVERILEAADKHQSVVIYGDYDVDGVTSITLLKAFLEAYGLLPTPFLPNRMDEGYGITSEGLKRCLADGKPDLLIAVDCGTSSVDEIKELGEQGIDVIILDHHEEGPNGRPQCHAIVNPKLGDAYHYLCSAGVVFKLGHGLLKKRWLDTLDLKSYLDLVAVGTVADIVPLVDENRLFVRKGLHRLESTENFGLAALKIVSSISSPINALDVGFRLGPRLNAAGRLESAQGALDLLLAEDEEVAEALADQLDHGNRKRQEVELKIVHEVNDLMETTYDPETDLGIALGSEAWHPGVVGIVASRIMRKYHRPTFIVAFDERGIGKGSGRSVKGVSLISALDHCRDLLLRGGGHDMAAGLTIEQDKFEAFQERFREAVSAIAEPGALVPRLHLDAEARLKDLSLEMLDSYELLQPFGQSNPQPLFLARAVQPTRPPTILKERHRKMFLTQEGGGEAEAMWFGSSDVDLPEPPWDVAFYVQRNTFRGHTKVQILIQALRKTP